MPPQIMNKQMKKLLTILLFIIICYTTPVMAEYKPIPENMRTQYKYELELLIKKEVPISKKAINNIEYEYITETNPVIKQTIIEYGITSILFDFYYLLIKVTNKYTDIEKDIPATDWYIELQKFINPYLIDNKINIKGVNSLLKCAERKQNKLNKQFNY